MGWKLETTYEMNGEKAPLFLRFLHLSFGVPVQFVIQRQKKKVVRVSPLLTQ